MIKWVEVLFFCVAILGCHPKQQKTHGEGTGRDSIQRKIVSLPKVHSDSLKSLIKKRSDQLMTDNGYQLGFLQSEIHQDSIHYYVTYRFVKENSKGGGGILILSKEDLEIIAKYLEE